MNEFSTKINNNDLYVIVPPAICYHSGLIQFKVPDKVSLKHTINKPHQFDSNKIIFLSNCNYSKFNNTQRKVINYSRTNSTYLSSKYHIHQRAHWSTNGSWLCT